MFYFYILYLCNLLYTSIRDRDDGLDQRERGRKREREKRETQRGRERGTYVKIEIEYKQECKPSV